MVLRLTCVLLAVAVVSAVLCVAPQPAAAADDVTVAGDLFYNFYVPADDGLGAELYLSPRPTPPMVGHTYITYQPLLPHEFLYRHARRYYTHHATGHVTRTRVSWR